MEVIDIDKEIDEKKTKRTDSEPIVITIKDSQRIKTRYKIECAYMEAFGIKKRNSYTITQMSPEEDEEEECGDGEDAVFADPKQKETIHYYAFEKDCRCGLIELSSELSKDPLIYLDVIPRFPGMDICEMLTKILNWEIGKDRVRKYFNNEKKNALIRNTGRRIEKSALSKELWERTMAIYDAHKRIQGDAANKMESGIGACCAVSMSMLFELCAGAMVKERFPEWNCFFEEGKANLMPVAKNAYKSYIAGPMIPDIVLGKGGKYIILDAKYKECDHPNRDDRLQLLAYADVYNAHIIGNIFPQKGSKLDFSFAKLNTQLEGDYYYLQFFLDSSGEKLEELKKKISETIGKQVGM